MHSLNQFPSGKHILVTLSPDTSEVLPGALGQASALLTFSSESGDEVVSDVCAYKFLHSNDAVFRKEDTCIMSV